MDKVREYFDDSMELQPLIHRLRVLRNELNYHIEKLGERANASGQVKARRQGSQTIYRRTYRTDSVVEKIVLLRNTALAVMRAYGTNITQRLYFVEYPIDDPANVPFCMAASLWRIDPQRRGS